MVGIFLHRKRLYSGSAKQNNRIHKSIIINLDKVREVFPWGSNSFSLRMRGYEDQILPIARDKTRILKQHLMGL